LPAVNVTPMGILSSADGFGLFGNTKRLRVAIAADVSRFDKFKVPTRRERRSSRWKGKYRLVTSAATCGMDTASGCCVELLSSVPKTK
jgi:hypothetical protein